MPSPLVFILASAAGVLVAAALGSGGSSGNGSRTIPPPKRVGRRLQSYTPPTLRATASGAPPQRDEVPPLTWSEFSGELRIGKMSSPGANEGPGYVDVDLAELYAGGGPVRVYADAYVVDRSSSTAGSTIAMVHNVIQVHEHTAAKRTDFPPTEQAERIVRDFATSNDGLVEGVQTTDLLDHNEPDPPALPRFDGESCTLGGSAAFHVDDCLNRYRGTTGQNQRAYEPGRTYNLTLQVRDGRVFLAARVMRLPFPQDLRWRVYTASEPR
jgi:hypothetical protein